MKSGRDRVALAPPASPLRTNTGARFDLLHDFPVQLFRPEPVGGMLMKGMTEAVHFCFESVIHRTIRLVSGSLATFTLCHVTLIPINVPPLFPLIVFAC